MREHFPAIREAEETARARPLTPGEELAYAVNVAHARRQHKSGRRRFDEWNRPI